MKDSKRIARLHELITLMKSGADVANRDLKNVLTESEWKHYQDQVESHKNLKSELMHVPALMKKYLQRLKRADLLYTRAEAMILRGNPTVRKKLYYDAEHEYEMALECLSEILQKDPNSNLLIDRPFRNDIAPTTQEVPRLVSSKSSYREPRNIESLHDVKRMLKLESLESSLNNLFNPKTQDEVSNQLKILKKADIDVSGIDFS